MIESMMLLSVGAVTNIRMSVFNTVYSHVGPAVSIYTYHAYTLELLDIYAELLVAKECLLDSVYMI